MRSSGSAERRGGDLQLGRISYDILGTIPIERVDLDIRSCVPAARSSSWRRC
jgi:hypothetical protein